MGKLEYFLSGVTVLEEITSDVNGKISVLKSFAFGPYIQVSSLTQSGGIIYGIWDKTLNKISKLKIPVSDCLIVGLGGGSVVKVIKKYWPEAEITGVDLDPVMVELGKKYLNLADTQVVIADAFDYLKSNLKTKTKKYDLILIDTYLGSEFPKKIESDEFIEFVRSTLTKKGTAVFNRLYYGEKRSEARKFGDRLEKHFKRVEYLYPEANVMLICSDLKI